MNVAYDLDMTITAYPEFYKNLMFGWLGGKKYIVTARPLTEAIITYNQLEEFGIFQGIHYDELIMYPNPYLFHKNGFKTMFFKDDGEVVFSSMEHRDEYLSRLLSEEKTKQLDITEIMYDIARWKTKVCLERDIKAVFEDNALNVQRLNEAGIYTFLVNKDFKSEP